MLTVEKCRKILGPDCKLSDSEIEARRDQLYGLADVSIDVYKSLPASRGSRTQRMRKAKSEAWKERAAIMEFEAGLPRSEAETKASHYLREEE